MSETTAPAPSAHELLLALAGWVDDDLLATGRELVAVGEEVPALELLVATLAAGRTALPEPVRASLVEGALALRVEPRADGALAPGIPPGDTAHRFSAEAGPAEVAVRVAGIASNLPVVARSGTRVSLVWRMTPAGAAPGPLPHPVLLAAVGTGGPVEVLAYQLGASLARAGVLASVEAFTEGAVLPPYHQAALDEALPLDPTTGADTATARSDLATGPRAAPTSRSTPGPGQGDGATPDGAEPASAVAETGHPSSGGPGGLEGGTRAAGPSDRGPEVPGPDPADAGDDDPIRSDGLLTHRLLTGSPLPDSSEPDPHAPGGAADETPAPEVPAPDVALTAVSAPDPSRPDVSAPDPSAPDPSAPDPSAPDASAPDASTPDLVGSDASTPARGTARSLPGTAGVAPAPGGPPHSEPPAPGRADPGGSPSGPGPVGGASGSPSCPAPGAGPFDDGRSPAHRYPATPARPDDGSRHGPGAVPPDRDPRSGAATDEPVYAHPAPRPAPRSIVPVPDDPEWFIDSAGSEGAVTPLTRAAPTGDPHPAPSTGPIAVPRGDDALDGPLDRPLLDPLLDQSGSAADAGPDGSAPRPGSDGGGSSAQDEWDRDWATGAWSASNPDLEQATGPTPAAGPRDGTRPRLQSVSDSPPILRAPVPPGGPTPAPRPDGHDAEATGPALPAASPQAADPSRPRHRLDVPDSAGTSDTGNPAEGPRLPGGAPTDLPAVETPGGAPAGDVADEVRFGAVADDAPGPPTPEPSPDRFTEAQAQHPSNQHPSNQHPSNQHPSNQHPSNQHLSERDRTGPDPAGSGPRPAPRPARDPRRAPSRRPTPGPDLGGRLTPNEQDLLRRLQQELAARENGSPDPGPRTGTSHPDAGPAAG